MPNSQVVNEKFLKDIKNATPVNTQMISETALLLIWRKFSGLGRRSNQPQHSLKPKPHLEQGPNSPQLYEG